MPILPLQPGTQEIHAGEAPSEAAAISSTGTPRSSSASRDLIESTPHHAELTRNPSTTETPAAAHPAVPTNAGGSPARQPAPLRVTWLPRTHIAIPIPPDEMTQEIEWLSDTPRVVLQRSDSQVFASPFDSVAAPAWLNESLISPFANLAPPLRRQSGSVTFATMPDAPDGARPFGNRPLLDLRRLTPIPMRSLEGPGWADNLNDAQETVMANALWDATDAAIEKLKAKFTDAPGPHIALAQITAHIEAMATKLRAEAEATQPENLPPLLRKRGGASEIDNALRTLHGERRPDDISDAIAQTPNEAELIAVVWHATGASRPGVAPETQANDTEVMRENLVMSLARCIEDDGHRVCGVGQRHRMVDVLKGFFPDEAGDALDDITPESVVTALAKEFDEAHADPTSEQVAAFKEHAQSVAQERFGADADKLRAFTRNLNTYIALAFD